jgi:hypothetical protein
MSRIPNTVTSLESLTKGVGSVSRSYGSADPDPHQNVTDPLQYCLKLTGERRDSWWCPLPPQRLDDSPAAAAEILPHVPLDKINIVILMM